MSGVLMIIWARGGSRGVPRENVRPFLEMPLQAGTHRHAQEAPYVLRITGRRISEALYR
jgi:CMP-N,N'-diacetyllegionaminic acid synthase